MPACFARLFCVAELSGVVGNGCGASGDVVLWWWCFFKWMEYRFYRVNWVLCFLFGNANKYALIKVYFRTSVLVSLIIWLITDTLKQLGVFLMPIIVSLNVAHLVYICTHTNMYIYIETCMKSQVFYSFSYRYVNVYMCAYIVHTNTI